MDWRPTIREHVTSNGGLATRRQLLERIPATVLDGHIGRGQLVRVFPHVYRLRDSPDDDMTALRAALIHTGPESAVSHTTALAVWGVRELERPLHVTVDESIRRAGAPGLIVHRRKSFDPYSAQCVERHGLRVTRLHRAVIDSWPLLPLPERRPLALGLVNRRLVTSQQLVEALGERPNVAGRRLLQQTIDLIADGVRSELEARGVLNVFRHRSLPQSAGQYRVQLPTRRSGSTGRGPRRSWRSNSTAPSTTRLRKTGAQIWSGTASWRRWDGSCCASPTPTCCETPRVCGPRCSRSTAHGWSSSAPGDRGRQWKLYARSGTENAGKASIA